jgi:hypothetical protein
VTVDCDAVVTHADPVLDSRVGGALGIAVDGTRLVDATGWLGWSSSGERGGACVAGRVGLAFVLAATATLPSKQVWMGGVVVRETGVSDRLRGCDRDALTPLTSRLAVPGDMDMVTRLAACRRGSGVDRGA